MGLTEALPKITIVLLNYKRPQNIPVILDAIQRQTIKPYIFLWNNGDSNVNSPRIDHYVESKKNAGCMARWHMAKESTTPYVMSMDDDICFQRPDALESVVKSLELQDHPNRIVGTFGARFNRNPVYSIRKEFLCHYMDQTRNRIKTRNTYQMHFGPEDMYVTREFVFRDEPVDIVKGRVMAFRKGLLDNFTLLDEREDDIFLSAAFANKARLFHRVPALLNDAFYELPVHGAGNWNEAGHFRSRNRALYVYFQPKQTLGSSFAVKTIQTAYLIKIFFLKIRHRLGKS